jgi:hypothetical protein
MSSSAVRESAHSSNSPVTNVVHASQFIRKMRGGSQPALIRCSNGRLYVVKFLDNQQGLNVLANEVMGHELLRTFGFPTPAWKAIYISRQFIAENPALSFETPMGSSPVRSGLHFGSEFLAGETTQIFEWLPSALSHRVVNSNDFCGIHLFDIWANHCDNRQCLFTTEDDGISFRAVFIDNGHLFGGPNWNRTRRRHESLSLDKHFHTLKWSAEVMESWISNFERSHSSLLVSAIQQVPKFWYSGDINSIVKSSLQRLAQFRVLLAEELKQKHAIA